jgi:hypothetical protein
VTIFVNKETRNNIQFKVEVEDKFAVEEIMTL